MSSNTLVWFSTLYLDESKFLYFLQHNASGTSSKGLKTKKPNNLYSVIKLHFYIHCNKMQGSKHVALCTRINHGSGGIEHWQALSIVQHIYKYWGKVHKCIESTSICVENKSLYSWYKQLLTSCTSFHNP
jgi:hypothetical protein